MAEPTRYYPYKPGTSCSVKDCGSPAEFEVYLYDYYPLPWDDDEFFQQDYTCPFLCRKHMEENEERAKGVRQPRGFVTYPFTNQHGAQGYSKYAPLSEVFPIIIDASSGLYPRQLISIYASVNDELIAYLAANPRALRELNPRRFEEVVAELFRKRGFAVELTPRTRDGGRDVLAVQSDTLGKSLYLIECKRYAPSRKVGVEVVRGLYGVLQADRATKGVIVTDLLIHEGCTRIRNPVAVSTKLARF